MVPRSKILAEGVAYCRSARSKYLPECTICTKKSLATRMSAKASIAKERIIVLDKLYFILGHLKSSSLRCETLERFPSDKFRFYFFKSESLGKGWIDFVYRRKIGELELPDFIAERAGLSLERAALDDVPDRARQENDIGQSQSAERQEEKTKNLPPLHAGIGDSLCVCPHFYRGGSHVFCNILNFALLALLFSFNSSLLGLIGFLFINFPCPLFAFSLLKFLTILSSKLWKLITATLPPPFREENPFSSPSFK